MALHEFRFRDTQLVVGEQDAFSRSQFFRSIESRILQTCLKFGMTRHPKYPVFTTAMVTGVNGPISVADCRKIVLLYLRAIAYIGPIGIPEAVRSICESVTDEESFLVRCIDDAKTAKAELRSLESSVKIQGDLEKEEERSAHVLQIRAEISDCNDEIDDYRSDLADLKRDRLRRLVDAVNRFVHGSEWRKICGQDH
jgi:hypothetical protein